MCFFLIKLLPVPEIKGLGRDANIIRMRREAMGYNKPLIEQYFIYLKRALVLHDLGVGEQMNIGQSISTVLKEKLPYTVMVNLYSILIAIPVGLFFGIYAALKKNKWQDHVISTGVMILISVPSYVYAFLIQYFLSYKLQLFPIQIYGQDVAKLGSFKMFYSMIPPILSLSLGTIAGFTRFSRAELSEVLTSDYLLLARTKGLTKTQSIVRHALRNAMVPILPMIISEFISILGGAMITEQIFGIPGIGQLYIVSINLRDYNFFLALTSFYTIIGLAAGIVVDLSYGFIDPRIRMGAK